MQTTIARCSLIFAALAAAGTLRAQDSVQLPWERVCQYANAAKPKTVLITTATGEVVEGTCFAVTVDALEIQTNHGIVQVARAQLKRISVSQVKPHHQFLHLAHNIGSGVKHSAQMVPT